MPRLFVLLLVAVGACARPVADRPYVASLELRGVHNVSARQLKKGLVSQPAGFGQRTARPFDELELERDRVRVQRHYESQGYYATKVVHAEGKRRPDGRAVDVLLAVEEGPPTLIGDVRVFGIDALDEKARGKLEKYQLSLRRGQVFHHEDYLRFKESLARELAALGYGRSVVEGKVIISPTSNLADIVVRLYPEGRAVSREGK